MSRLLASILASKNAELAALHETPAASRRHPPRAENVIAALRRGAGEPLRMVTEIKRRSPSAGALSTTLSVRDRAVAYARAGASMISVLCDAPFFDGSWDHVTEARAALDDAGHDVAVLAKEFVIDERQVEEAAVRGADAVLLVVRIIDGDRQRLAKLIARARGLGLEPLVEVVTEDELDVALAANARVIGVNARDLDTLVMDPVRAARVLDAIPDGCIAVHLSGLRTPSDVAAVAATSVDAALIGEALMREDDPSPLLAAMATAARSAL